MERSPLWSVQPFTVANRHDRGRGTCDERLVVTDGLGTLNTLYRLVGLPGDGNASKGVGRGWSLTRWSDG